MKKLSAFILAIALVLVLSMLLTGCGLAHIGDKIEGGDDSLPIGMEESQRKVSDLGTRTGYQITFSFDDGEDSSGTYTVGKKGDKIWCLEEDEYGFSGYGMVKDGTQYHYYNVEEDGEFTYSATIQDSDSYYGSYAFEASTYYWMYYGHSFDGSLTKLGSTTVAGRAATEYEFNMGAMLGFIGSLSGLKDFKYKVAVDNELGITLKLEAEIKTTEEKESMSYTVTSFKTGNNVTVPNFPAPTPGNENDGEEWDSPYTGGSGNVGSNKPEVQINSAADLHSVTNQIFVARYAGTQEQLTNEDDVFVDDYGADSIYYVWSGFNADGSCDYIHGYCCLYYFYSDTNAYLNGLDNARGLRQKNDAKHYFTVTARNVDAETYSEFLSDFEGYFEYPHFEIVR